MFCKMLYTNPELCKQLLELILGKGIKQFFDFLSGKEPKGRLATEIAQKVELAVKHEEWRTEYMTLLQRDREKFAEGLAQGMAQGNIRSIQKLIKRGMDKDFILSLDYTEEEIEEAEKQLLATAQ